MNSQIITNSSISSTSNTVFFHYTLNGQKKVTTSISIDLSRTYKVKDVHRNFTKNNKQFIHGRDVINVDDFTETFNDIDSILQNVVCGKFYLKPYRIYITKETTKFNSLRCFANKNDYGEVTVCYSAVMNETKEECPKPKPVEELTEDEEDFIETIEEFIKAKEEEAKENAIDDMIELVKDLRKLGLEE